MSPRNARRMTLITMQTEAPNDSEPSLPVLAKLTRGWRSRHDHCRHLLAGCMVGTAHERFAHPARLAHRR